MAEFTLWKIFKSEMQLRYWQKYQYRQNQSYRYSQRNAFRILANISDLTGLYSHAWYKSLQAAVHFCWHGNILYVLAIPVTDEIYELMYCLLLAEIPAVAEPVFMSGTKVHKSSYLLLYKQNDCLWTPVIPVTGKTYELLYRAWKSINSMTKQYRVRRYSRRAAADIRFIDSGSGCSQHWPGAVLQT